jgi:hypothetical protein
VAGWNPGGRGISRGARCRRAEWLRWLERVQPRAKPQVDAVVDAVGKPTDQEVAGSNPAERAPSSSQHTPPDLRKHSTTPPATPAGGSPAHLPSASTPRGWPKPTNEPPQRSAPRPRTTLPYGESSRRPDPRVITSAHAVAFHRAGDRAVDSPRMRPRGPFSEGGRARASPLTERSGVWLPQDGAPRQPGGRGRMVCENRGHG